MQAFTSLRNMADTGKAVFLSQPTNLVHSESTPFAGVGLILITKEKVFLINFS